MPCSCSPGCAGPPCRRPGPRPLCRRPGAAGRWLAGDRAVPLPVVVAAADRIRAEFAQVLTNNSPTGRAAQLIVAAELLQSAERGDHPELISPLRSHAGPVLRAEPRMEVRDGTAPNDLILQHRDPDPPQRGRGLSALGARNAMVTDATLRHSYGQCS